jgi:DNA-binding MarR family transcriptional regulator
MLHAMRNISEQSTSQGTETVPGKPASVDAILTEVSGWVGELRCASMGRLVQSQVSLSHMHVLWVLQHHGAMSMSKLAEYMDVSLSNATGIIDRMEEKGLIERERVPDDRRVVLVRPGAAGIRALAESETTKRERLRAVLGHLSASERTIVLAAFGSLRRALSAEVDNAPAHHHHFADAAH